MSIGVQKNILVGIITQTKHEVFPERRYKRTWKSVRSIDILSLNRGSIYIVVNFPFTLLSNILSLCKSWRKCFVKSLHFLLPFQNVYGWMKDWTNSKKSPVFNLIQDRNFDFLRNILRHSWRTPLFLWWGVSGRDFHIL